MWNVIHKLGSARTCYRLSNACAPWVGLACLIALAYGLTDGLLIAPPDYQQGNIYRIMYLHVPSAIWSLGVYMVMTVAAIFYFVWKLKIADIVAKVSAPMGAMFTFFALVTGSIWGKPTWGTYWIWDARLTSELILLFIYFGIMALRASIPEPRLAAKASGILILVGVVNIPIIHYSVNWWNTLHQGATLLKLSKPSIAPTMLYPLLAMIVAFMLYYVWYLLLKVRQEILQREADTHWVKEMLAGRL